MVLPRPPTPHDANRAARDDPGQARCRLEGGAGRLQAGLAFCRRRPPFRRGLQPSLDRARVDGAATGEDPPEGVEPAADHLGDVGIRGDPVDHRAGLPGDLVRVDGVGRGVEALGDDLHARLRDAQAHAPRVASDGARLTPNLLGLGAAGPAGLVERLLGVIDLLGHRTDVVDARADGVQATLLAFALLRVVLVLGQPDGLLHAHPSAAWRAGVSRISSADLPSRVSTNASIFLSSAPRRLVRLR